MHQKTEDDLDRDKFSDWRQTENGTTNKQLNESGADGRERFSRVWLLRADKLTMVETQSHQFLSHRTSTYIISLLSPPVPLLQHRWSMLAISLQTRVFYLHRARLQKAAVNSTSASPPGKFMQELRRKTQTEQKMFKYVSRVTEFAKDASKQ